MSKLSTQVRSFASNDICSESQFGFQSGKFTIDAISSMISKVLEELEVRQLAQIKLLVI